MNNKKETVEVERRRRPQAAPPGGRPRAEAPQRQGSEPPPPPAPSGGGGRPPGLPSMPSGGRPVGGGKPLSIGALVLIVVCVVAFLVFRGLAGGDTSSDQTAQDQGNLQTWPTEIPEVQAVEPTLAVPTRRPAVLPTAPGTAGSTGQRWLVMLFQDADDKILEQDIYLDLNEAERVGSTERVQIVAQIDRFKGGFQGDGNWTNTRRYFITQDDDLDRLHSQQVGDLGEVNMAEGQTLVDFIVWAVQNYPADKYVLILSDHGMGWPGGWSDSDPANHGDSKIPLEARLDDHLYLQEIDQALAQARQQTGIDQFELIGMDACLMGHLEVFSALQPHARYAVASQEVEPALGWAYTSFLTDLAQNPDMDGAELGRRIVESYVVDDQRIVDDQARAEFLRQGSPMGGLFGLFQSSPQQLARQMGADITLTAVDLSAIPALLDRFNDFAYALQQVRQPDVAGSRTHAQSFTSVFGSDVPASYIDLGSFLQILQQNGASGPTFESLQAALQQAVIAEKNGPKKPGATGISIYFPNSDLYKLATTGPRSYTAIASRFATQSLWDDYLAFHYTGRSFEPATQELVVPSPQTAVQPPGAGEISVSEINISSRSVAPGQKVSLSADIKGQNIGYVYLFVGYLDEQSNSIFVADTDYLESKETREANGIYYPVWPKSGDFTMQYQWEPVVFAISDGQQSVVTAMRPQTYGVSFKQAVYTVDGIYTYADGGEQRYARLYFSDEVMTQVYGYTDADMTGAPHEITPSRGDTFTVLQRWIELGAGGQMANEVSEQGDTLTFGADVFRWQTLDAAAGQYVIGFLVSDLDGKLVPAYTRLTVR